MHLPEILYLIVSKCDGFERENMRLVCKMFNEFKFIINTDNPIRDREISYVNINTLELLYLYGHIDLLRIFMRNHPDYVYHYIKYSCKYGTLSLLKKIDTDRNSLYESSVWATGLHLACRYSHINVIRYILRNGYTKCCWLCFSEAIVGGNIDTIKYLIYVNPSYCEIESYYFTTACKSGHLHIVRWLIRHGYAYWQAGFVSAVEGGNIEIVKLMIEKHQNHDWNSALVSASGNGYLDIVKLMIEKGANKFRKAFRESCRRNQINVMEYFLSKGFNVNDILVFAVGSMNDISIDYALINGANNFDEVIETARSNGLHIIAKKIERFKLYRLFF